MTSAGPATRFHNLGAAGQPANPSLIGEYIAAMNRHGDAVALEIADQSWSYRELAAAGAKIASAIGKLLPAGDQSSGEPQMVAVFASRTLTTYAGTLGVFASGRSHVALNPAYPPERNASILRQSGAGVIVTEPESLSQLREILQFAEGPFDIIAPEGGEGIESLSGLPNVGQVWSREELASANATLADPANRNGDLAYVVFTSGSTGEPKGVAITHGHLAVYMRNFRDLAAPVREDRVAQTYELTFDVALHDMFNAWWSGATLVVVPARALMAPARFILDKAITYWFAVASSAMVLQRQKILKPGLFPLLRVSLLCGEPLPVNSAIAWAEAAPNSSLYNVYGPTETTMELAFYPWNPATSPAQCLRGVVPIGIPFAGHRHILLDEDGRLIEGAGRGELLLSGPQIGPGYWRDPTRTAAAFVKLKGDNAVWYRTGDLIERDKDGMYHFVGRLDHQIKIRGHRVELGEIEAALRDLAGTDLVAVIPHANQTGTIEGLAAFVAGTAIDVSDLRTRLATRVPPHMIPEKIITLADFPLNANRKVDRGALAKLLEAARG